MAGVDTLPAYLRPLMEGCSIRQGRCVVCGKTWPLNQHHVVYRSSGKMFKNGVEVPKPTLTLCGNGNTGGCHGKAHHHTLHFRWVPEKIIDRSFAYQTKKHPVTVNGGHWEYMFTDEPVPEFDALQIEEGWRPINDMR